MFEQKTEEKKEEVKPAGFTQVTPSPSEEPKPVIKKRDTNFRFSETALSGKEVFTVYGEKGAGKTSFALSFPGTIAVLSFDRKSMMVKMNYFGNDPRIKIYDAVEFWDRDTDEKNETAELTYKYVCFILDEIKKNKPDWVVVDGVEIFSKIAECVMRFRHNLTPYQGVVNLNIWKERNDVIAQVHKKAVDACGKGVIYTTYTQTEEMIQEGTIITRVKVPKYIDQVMWETDYVLHIDNLFDVKSKKTQFILRVVSSKNDAKMKTGLMLDITGVKQAEKIFPNMEVKK